ncbi:FG-GAP repeat protein [Geodermatophilus sp. YIM 151500]|uniref:FG-GAP repeat protein n=1 Tax=Geodermatophilus sp. YIM 151500 TaxID=2984531 RepID=UPI0021E411BE|nr:FG-GAP repeat protein [Geodermatophilus sp. YIM 151500]MCV2490900.1 FG-GAP repeat protein [Geodermatophilus sp. YIM 151500]
MTDRRTPAVTVLATALAAAGTLIPAPVAEAQPAPIVATTKLSVPGLEDGSRFGTSVAIWGAVAVVGAPFDDYDGKTDAGAAYVFRRSGATWVQEAMLTGVDTASGDQFGASVDVFSGGIGTHLVIGAPFDDNPGGTDAGAAYVFTRVGTTWTQSRKVTIAHNRGGNDRFGSSVTIARSDALIGVPLDDTTGAGGLSQSGSVTAFYRPEDWGFRSSLTAGGSAGDFEFFGSAVEMSALTAVVGAPEDDQRGSVHVFVRPDDPASPWTPQARLTSPLGGGKSFGTSVAVFGDFLVVGEPVGSSNFFCGNLSIVYFFARAGVTWTAEGSLDCAPANAAAFGQSVAIDTASGSPTALVGAPDTNQRTGEAYVYRRIGSDFGLHETIRAVDASATDKFGYDVDLSGGTAVIGAPEDNVAGTDDGSAYVVSVP